MPVGLAANLLVTVEALINIVGVALATGLVFARLNQFHPGLLDHFFLGSGKADLDDETMNHG